MNPTIWLIRHGETSMNVSSELRGWEDPPLTTKGIEQAQAAGKFLQGLGVPLAHIYTGTLKRTVDTGQIVADMLQLSVTQNPSLNPWDYGKMTGVKDSKRNLRQLKWFQDHANAPVPGGESYGAFLGRWTDALKALVSFVTEHPEKGLVVVTHSRNMYPVRGMLDGKSPTPMHDDSYGPGSVFRIEFDGPKGKLSKLV